MNAAVIIPAFNEEDRIGETVRKAREIRGVSSVVVVDDGSSDATADEARRAGADIVIRLPENRGKGAALIAGAQAAAEEILVFLDADLAESASAAQALIEPVASGEADMTIALLPKPPKSGGFGFAVGLAGWGIAKFTGLRMKAPISGQRAIRREIFDRIGRLDGGFGVEVGLTIDAHRIGARIVEVPVDMSHRATGRSVKGFIHRGRQFWHIAGALVRRLGWRKANFRGDNIPAVLGIFIAAAGAVGALVSKFVGFDSHKAAESYFIAAVGFGLLGLADDLFGSREVGGFKGHFRKLIYERRLTTGVIKAVGGGAAAIWLGYRTSSGEPVRWIVDSLIIALAANTVNLLDLRPGRALFAYFVIGCAVIIAAGLKLSAVTPIAAITLAAIVSSYWDARGRAMLGDVGSNVLGASVGLLAALDAAFAWKCALIVLFFIVNYYSERSSISNLIERRPVLRWIDSRLGVR